MNKNKQFCVIDISKDSFDVVDLEDNHHQFPNELLRSTNRSYQITRGSPDGTIQLNLFGSNSGGDHFGN